MLCTERFSLFQKQCKEFVVQTPFLIASIHPHSTHLEEVASHPLVGGLRFNTIVPSTQSPKETLQKLQAVCGDKPLWIDVKGRQLRVMEYTDLFYAAVRISHPIKVDLPSTVFFKDYVHPGRMMEATITEIEGNRLILTRHPCRPLGKGEALNILDPSLVIEGYLTDQDRAYLEAANELGIPHVMASFFEQWSDKQDILVLHPNARVMAKIESLRGVEFIRTLPAEHRLPLMAALDDLYIQSGPEFIYPVLAGIQKCCSNMAVAASRILTSLEEARSISDVSFQDIMTILGLMKMKYRAFMLSDGLCYDAETFRMAMQTWGHLMEQISLWEETV